MADIRIKDLATLESASLTGDVFVIDGTTGTRKLSAFSPSFGGNATVTGTLTGNSTITAAGNIKSSLSSSGATAGILIAENSAAAATGNQASVFLPTSTGASTYWQLNARQNSATLNDQTLRVVFGGVAQHTYFNASDLSVQSGITLKVLDTTASTTTSSGALVVGNGTSGGLGVGGAGNFGGAVGVGGATVASRLHVYESTSGTGDSNGITIEQASTADAALQFLLTGVQRWTVGIDNSDSDKFKIGTGAIGSADRLTIDTSGNLSIPATTASTSTSSGALVVSGGVGVAGAIYAGNAINATVNGGASIIGRNGSASSFTSIVAYSGASDEVKGTLTSSTAGVIIVGSQTNHPLAVYVNNAEVARWDTSANFQTRVTGTAPSLATNSTMTFELTSNTSLKIFVRGSDGTTRSTTLTLA